MISSPSLNSWYEVRLHRKWTEDFGGGEVEQEFGTNWTGGLQRAPTELLEDIAIKLSEETISKCDLR